MDWSRAVRSMWVRGADRRALVSAAVRAACADRGVELIRYTDLAAAELTDREPA